MTMEEALRIAKANPSIGTVAQIDAEWIAYTINSRFVGVDNVRTSRGCGLQSAPRFARSIDLNFPKHVARWLKANVDPETLQFRSSVAVA